MNGRIVVFGANSGGRVGGVLHDMKVGFVVEPQGLSLRSGDDQSVVLMPPKHHIVVRV